MSAPSASMEQTRALQRPHNTFALTGQCKKTTAQSGSNDRTIRPQRPHDSAASSAPFQKGLQTAFFHPLPQRSPDKSQNATGFLKNVSAFKRKHFDVWNKTFRRFRKSPPEGYRWQKTILFSKKEAFYLESYFFFLHLRQETNKTFFYENNNGKYILLVAPLTTPKVVRGTQPCVDTWLTK